MLLGSGALCLIGALAVLLPRLLKAGYVRHHLGHGVPQPTMPASVVVYTHDDTEGLTRLLPQLLSQEYPAGYEVIVVNDGGNDATCQVVDRYMEQYRNLYYTFTPDEARSLSRHKLALTLGIKASHNPIVVTTTSDAEVSSPHWLSHICAPFDDPSIEVVLGLPRWPAENDTQPGRRRRAFDFAADTLTWLNAALSHRPWRGDVHNLAFLRQRFFANKGFSRSLNRNHGIDDIFVSEIARGDNTDTVLAPEGSVVMHPVKLPRYYREMKLNRAFTSRGLGRRPRLAMGLASLLLWAWTLLATGGMCVALPNLFAVALWGALTLAGWTALVWAWRRAMHTLGAGSLRLTLPWLILTRPFYNALYRRRGTNERRRNYTWQ